MYQKYIFVNKAKIMCFRTLSVIWHLKFTKFYVFLKKIIVWASKKCFWTSKKMLKLSKFILQKENFHSNSKKIIQFIDNLSDELKIWEKGRGKSMEIFQSWDDYFTKTSTLLFCERPTCVVFESTGLDSPKALKSRRAESIPRLTR